MMKLPTLILLLLWGYSSCLGQQEFDGFPYDPEGATVTTDKKIQPQLTRTIGFPQEGISFDNNFSGARMQDVRKISPGKYQISINPEISPVNNSPWYAFRIKSDSARSITLELRYQDGHHRYRPKITTNGEQWTPVEGRQRASSDQSVTFSVEVGPEPVLVSAQELMTVEHFRQWAHSLATHPDVSMDVIGFSHDTRPVPKLKISSVPGSRERGVLILTGRQHPPEVTGALASQAFIEALVSDHPTAITFRHHFEVWAYPMVNPDGVQRGHWRQNAAGVDLNRDWRAFHQPETRSIRDDLLALKEDSLRKVYYGIDFHSTKNNIFYPIDRHVKTFPNDFTYQWIDSLQTAMPDFDFTVESFDTQSPITKNWIYHTFGADAVTYEMDDAVDRETLQEVARTSAFIIMRQLIRKKVTQDLLLTER